MYIGNNGISTFRYEHLEVDSASTNFTGLLESYSSVRHVLNIYPGVAFSGKYTHKTKKFTGNTAVGIVYGALRKVISQHPSLAFTLQGLEDDNHAFEWAKEIDLKKQVVIEEELTPEQENDEVVTKRLSKMFEDVDTIPPWRVIVIPAGNELYVTFAFHHAIGDGTTGKVFLQDFGHALNSTESTDDSIVKVSCKTFPPSLETALKMPMGIFFMLKLLAREVGILSKPQGQWVGKPLTYNKEKFPLQTVMKRVVIDSDTVKIFLAECKKKGARLVALVDAICVVSADQVLGPEHKALSSSIPRNLRPLMDSVGANDMGVHVASVDFHTERATLDKIGTNPVDKIWAVCESYSKDITDALNLKNYNLNAGLLKYVGKVREYILKRLESSERCSIEHSCVLMDSHADEGDWSLDNVWFSQCASPTGAVIGISSSGFKNGNLNLLFSYSHDIVSPEIMEQVLSHYADNVNSLVESLTK